MRSVAAEDLNIPGVRISQDEISFLENSFQHMIRRIDELINNVYKETIYRRESELKVLQAQINPHFLFNVLDLLNWKALMARQTEISELVQSLSRLMEANMRIEEKTVTVGRELDYIRDYFRIMSKKFGDRIALREEVDDEAAEEPIPKLLLQPLVENAIKHGFEYLDGGEIRLKAIVSGDRLLMRVEDTGRGMTADRLREVRFMLEGAEAAPFWVAGEPSADKRRLGVGLINIAQRLRVVYGDQATILIKSGEGRGTSLDIQLPRKTREEEQHVQSMHSG